MSGDDRVVVAQAWSHGGGVLDLRRPAIMAVLNVTPDSFSDGGRFHGDEGARVEEVLAHGRACMEAGASVLDVGGESTRPGAAPVTHDDELARVLPVLEALLADEITHEAVISVDTRHGAVAREVLRRGAHVINDVGGLADPALLDAVAASSAGLVIGHMRGTPTTMMQGIRFEALLEEIAEELRASVSRATSAGIDRARILVDPGIGFGKTGAQSAALVASGGWLREQLGCPVLIGASRKRFIGELTGRDAARRVSGSVGAALAAVRHGASMVRVHDVEETRDALVVWAAVEAAARAEGLA